MFKTNERSTNKANQNQDLCLWLTLKAPMNKKLSLYEATSQLVKDA